MQGTSEVCPPENSEGMKLFYKLASKIKRVEALEHLNVHYRFTIYHKQNDDRKHVSREMVSKIIAENLKLEETKDFYVYSTGNNKLLWCKNFLDSSRIITDHLIINLYLQTNGHLLVTKSIDESVCRKSCKEFISAVGKVTHTWEEDQSMWTYFSEIKNEDFTKITTCANENGFDLNFLWYKIEQRKPPQPLFDRKLTRPHRLSKSIKPQNNNNSQKTYVDVVKSQPPKNNNLVENNEEKTSESNKKKSSKKSKKRNSKKQIEPKADAKKAESIETESRQDEPKKLSNNTKLEKTPIIKRRRSNTFTSPEESKKKQRLVSPPKEYRPTPLNSKLLPNKTNNDDDDIVMSDLPPGVESQ